MRLDLYTADVSVFVCCATLLLSLNWLLYKTWRTIQPRDDRSLRSVAILVLGDIGRSPRMMYHAQSFAELGFMTDLIGYGGVYQRRYQLNVLMAHTGSKPIPSLEQLPRVRIRYLPELPKLICRLPFFIYAPIKVVYQVIQILLALLVWIEVPPEFILVQVCPTTF